MTEATFDIPWASLTGWVATITIALAALAALGVSIWSGRQAKKTAHANTVSIFMAEYASSRMHDALVALRKFEKKHKPFLDALSRLVTSRNNLTQRDVDNAQNYINSLGNDYEPYRRKVGSFYNRAWLLYDNGYLSKKAFLIIGDTSGKELLPTIVRPLTCAVHLIDLCDGDREKYRINPPDFRWLDEFSKVVNAERPGKRSMKAKIISCGLIGGRRRSR